MEPATIAALLREVSIYFELDGDRHRAGAYDRAAHSIEAANGLHRLVEEGRLEDLPAVGPSIARVVGDLWRRGSTDVLERLRAKWPPVVVELALLPKVGAQRARELYKRFQPADLEAIAAACRAGAVRELRGFGAVSEARILQAIEERHLRGVRVLLLDATDSAATLAAHLAADPVIARVEVAGPVRRGSEIVDHLAFAVATEADPDVVLDRLATFALVTSVDRAQRVGYLAGGMRVHVHVATPARFGWALIQATGSPAHVVALEQRARERGLDLAALATATQAPPLAAEVRQAPPLAGRAATRSGAEVSERRVYLALGLPWIPPELRDGTDEVAAAAAGDTFADLVVAEDVTTAFHCHTTYSDGKASIAEMALAAAERGFAAITITDHSAAATYAGGIGADGLRAQAAEIAALVDPPARVLRGIEADILVDGAIDVPGELVGELDVVIASIHQRFKLDEDAATARVIAAMRQPFFKVWGHALGRLVLRREPVALRIDDVLDVIAESRAAIEINGDPYRLDLDPDNVRKALARNIRVVLSVDAHSTRGLDALKWAVIMARRARVRKRDVLNALPVDEMAAAIRPTA
jgi:DNA polymerase (family 10)